MLFYCYCRSPKSLIEKRDVAPISGINILEYQLPEQMDRQFNTLLQQFLNGSNSPEAYLHSLSKIVRSITTIKEIITACYQKHANTTDVDTVV